MVVKIKKGWVSGPKFCGRDGRYHHIICFYIYMIHDLECKEESTVNNMLKTKKMKNIKSFEDCRNKCQQNVKCDFLNFKVKRFEFGILFQLIHFQHHQNLKKRRCVLLKVFTEKIGWVSGEKLCSSSKSTTASTALMNTTTINTNGGTLNSYLNLNQINYMYI